MDFTKMEMTEEEIDESSVGKESDDDDEEVPVDDKEANVPDIDEDMDENEEHDESDELLIYNLTKQVGINPYNYDAHLKLIEALRKYGDLEKVRGAREKFAASFPLAPKFWLEWINDERRIETSWEELRDLFEKAVRDYVSVEVWLEYVQVACGHLGPKEIRELFERALIQIGVHVADGRLVWDAYRVLESALMQSGAGSEDQLLQIYKRQLSIPLVGAVETKQEFVDTFGEEKFDGKLSAVYNSAMEELQSLAPFEQELISSKYSMEAYLKYLDHEERGGKPTNADGTGTKEKEKEKNKDKSTPNIVRLHCLYERAITDHCLNIELWLRYTTWLNKRFTSAGSIVDLVLPIYERAIRNCSWSTALWSKYALAHERSRAENWMAKADEVFERALNEGAYRSATEAADLWLMRAYQKKRAVDMGIENCLKVEEIFEKGSSFLSAAFGDHEWDQTGQYRRSWATYLASQCRKAPDDDSTATKMAKAREIWNAIVGNDGNYRLASVWLEWYQFERRFGDSKSIRALLFRAMNAVTDFPDFVASTLRQYELEEGSLAEFDESEERIRRHKARMDEKKQHVHAFTAGRGDGGGGGGQRWKKEAPEGEKMAKPKSEATPKRTPGGKRKGTDEQIAPQTAKKPKNADDGFAKPFPPMAAPTTSAASTGAQPHTVGQRQNPNAGLSEAERQRRTVFVSNLNFYVKEHHLKEIIDKLGVGNVVDIRLSKLNSERSKGFAYVEFDNEESVKKAVAHDRHPIDGRPMYIAECKERGAGGAGDSGIKKLEKALGVGEKNAAAEKYHFGAGLEKNKLFVRNIPKHATEEDLKAIFEPFGAMKAIRLVTFPSGQSKGMAYLEYEDVECAAKAVAQANGQVLFERALEVAISNPPPRRGGGGAGARGRGGGGGQFRGQSLGEGGGKAMLMMPRALGAGGRKSRVDLG